MTKTLPFALPSILCLGFCAPQESEFKLRWDLEKDQAFDYEIYEAGGGKPKLLPDRSFVVFPADLKEDGGNSLVVNAYRDLGYHLLFLLPPNPVKVKSKWVWEGDFFDKGRRALVEILAFRTIKVRGQLQLRKIEKVNDVECALIEGQYQYFDVRYDNKDRPDVQKNPSGQISTVQWVSLKETALVKGLYAFKGRGQEFKGIKQGEEPKTSKENDSEQIVLKKDRLTMDLKTNHDAIQKAIQKGVEWLKSKQEANGSYVDRGGSFAREFPTGSTALCAMALLHSGVKSDDPVIAKAFQYMKAQPFKSVYDVSTVVMAFETKYLPLEKMEDVQSFTEEEAEKAVQAAIHPEDKAYVEKCAKWLLSHQTKYGTWGYPEQEEAYDHSNTQYAMLALKSAARCGVAVPVSVWRKAAMHWCDTQRTTGLKAALKLQFHKEEEAGIDVKGTRAEDEYDQGPWGYFTSRETSQFFQIPAPDAGYGSMTCAGLTSLLVAESELVGAKDLDNVMRKRIDACKKSGLAWIQSNYSVRGNLPSAGFWSVFYYYYLFSIERVGVLYGIHKIDGHDWYLEGSILLVRSQKTDGSWMDYDEIPVLDTAFALLFLKKATVRVATHTAGVTK